MEIYAPKWEPRETLRNCWLQRNRYGELIKKTAYYTSLGFKTVGYATLTIKDTETRWWGMQRPPAAKSAEYA